MKLRNHLALTSHHQRVNSWRPPPFNSSAQAGWCFASPLCFFNPGSAVVFVEDFRPRRYLSGLT